MIRSLLAIALTLTLAFAIPSFSEEPGGCVHACQAGKFEMTHATGTLYCVGCALKQQYGAKIDCDKGGHQLAIKVTKCEDYCGEAKPALVGKTLFFLPTDAAMKIDPMKQYGATVTLSGRYYFDSGVIEPEDVKVESDETVKKG